MARFTTSYVCQQCGYVSPSYLGRCPECDNWNTFVEETQNSNVKTKNLKTKAEIIDLSKIEKTRYQRIDTGFEEFNRVLGGGPPRRDGRVEAGMVVGSLILVAGDPGIGKSTLLTQLSLQVDKTLYITGEESPQQIKLRVDRIKLNSNLSVLNEVDVDVIINAIEQFKPSLVVVDSIQVLETSDLESIAGSVGQVRECAHRLQRVAKSMHIPIFLVGHVTKEGTIAGPKTLEHLVDVVLSLEGDTINQFRILRSSKNRFGPTDEVGIFEMEDVGMRQVKNPSKLFLEQKTSAPGSAVVALIAGLRPILVEIQALVTRTSLAIPRRTGSGIDNNRLQLLVAVLQRRMGLPLFDQDVFVNVTGGFRLTEPAADLGICLAIVSSFKDVAIKDKMVFVGEIGLLGEIRTVRQIEKRVTEAKKLGFSSVVSSQNAKNLAQALKTALAD